MSLRPLLILLGILIVVGATGWKAASNAIGNKLNYSPPCKGIFEARLYRVFVAELTAHPRTIQAGEETVTIESAWIEKRSKIEPLFVWIPHRTPKDGYVVRFIIKSAPPKLNDALWKFDGAMHGMMTDARVERPDAEFATLPESVFVTLLSRDGLQPLAEPIHLRRRDR